MEKDARTRRLRRFPPPYQGSTERGPQKKSEDHPESSGTSGESRGLGSKIAGGEESTQRRRWPPGGALASRHHDRRQQMRENGRAYNPPDE